VESTWVGIGGAGETSGALLQTGIEDACVNHTQRDTGWFEEYPGTPNASVTFPNFPVAPGNSIAASVIQTSSDAWETRVDDLTTGYSGVMISSEGWGVASDASAPLTFTVEGAAPVPTYSGGDSAEWIVEDPTDGATDAGYPFANYGTVTFTNLSTSIASWSFSTTEGWEIVQNGVTLSTPTPSTNSFTVTYTGP
jgi:hypothetical protein